MGKSDSKFIQGIGLARMQLVQNIEVRIGVSLHDVALSFSHEVMQERHYKFPPLA